MQKTAIYPGSFDPVTNGHLDIVERGLKLFDKIIVAILTNPGKKFLFPLE
ncbi:MAG: adenylyltransferase/cytidyltransferase family protein, partial [Desulfobacterales bacterium]